MACGAAVRDEPRPVPGQDGTGGGKGAGSATNRSCAAPGRPRREALDPEQDDERQEEKDKEDPAGGESPAGVT
jgi:hypothetical protein